MTTELLNGLSNQKLEKFECDECGCFFMVADRNGFVCPNCEDKEDTFECEGCGRTLPESEMSDVMEMGICNRCEEE